MSVTEVAKMAGVSRMTVSRVVNDDPRVKPETARQVRAAIATLNYVPPSPLSDGRRRKSRSVVGLHTSRIAVLIPDTNADAMRTTLSGRLLHGVDGPVDEHRLQMLLTRLPAPRTLPACIDRRQVDGVLVRYIDSAWLFDALSDIPVVWIFSSALVGEARDHVDTDDTAVGTLALDFLRGRGHRHLATFNDMHGHPAHLRRIERFSQKARIDGPPPRRVDMDGIGQEALNRQFARLLQPDDRPTGFFLPGTGLIVSRVQHAIRAAGFLPGQDIDLIGCGHDHHLVEAMYPQPANIDIQPEAIGTAAAELLIWRLGNPAAPVRQVTIPPKLMLPPA